MVQELERGYLRCLVLFVDGPGFVPVAACFPLSLSCSLPLCLFAPLWPSDDGSDARFLGLLEGFTIGGGGAGVDGGGGGNGAVPEDRGA